MPKKRTAPKGILSLIPVGPKKAKKKKESVYYVEIKKIRLNPHSRASEGQVDKKELRGLINSVRKYGVVEPISVLKVETKKRSGGLNVYYRLVSGRKRLLAAKEVGLKVVPAKIRRTAE